MAVNHITGVRQRPVPRSTLSRGSAFSRMIAAWHDKWLRRRAETQWARELDALDMRTLRDIGLSQAEAGDLARKLRGTDQKGAEITFPPHCFQGVAKLSAHLEG